MTTLLDTSETELLTATEAGIAIGRTDSAINKWVRNGLLVPATPEGVAPRRFTLAALQIAQQRAADSMKAARARTAETKRAQAKPKPLAPQKAAKEALNEPLSIGERRVIKRAFAAGTLGHGSRWLQGIPADFMHRSAIYPNAN